MKYVPSRAWLGETVVIIAGGPSVKTSRVRELLSGKTVKIVAINDSWRLFPRADVLYFCDESWWTDQIRMNLVSEEGDSFEQIERAGFWVTCCDSFLYHPVIRNIESRRQLGLETIPGQICHGSNSGYQCINLVFQLGVKKIVLVGYDMKTDGATTHWHDGPRAPHEQFAQTLALSMLPNFNTLVEPLAKAGVRVLNACPDSALTCWPRMSLEQALQSDS